jgi:tetratricopeptide (TPR) repeat protein
MASPKCSEGPTPEAPSSLAAKAQAFVAEGNLTEAERLLGQLAAQLGKDAESTRLGVQLGMVQVRLGKLREAAETLRALPQHAHARLHLGHALRFMGELDEAAAQYRSALSAAERERDGPLAMASLCGLGEGLLEQRLGKEAAEHFGRALGISEWLADERLTVLPLAGLAQAHALWGNPGKAEALAVRAVQRAHEPLAVARAHLALGAIRQDSSALDKGLAALARSPHEPLRVQLLVAKFALTPTATLRGDTLALARRYGMQGVQRALQPDA